MAKIYQFDIQFIWLINACKHNQEVTVEMEVGIVDSAIISTIRAGPNPVRVSLFDSESKQIRWNFLKIIWLLLDESSFGSQRFRIRLDTFPYLGNELSGFLIPFQDSSSPNNSP